MCPFGRHHPSPHNPGGQAGVTSWEGGERGRLSIPGATDRKKKKMESHTDPRWKVAGPKKKYRLRKPVRDNRSDQSLGVW